MLFKIGDTSIETNTQGYLDNLEDWSEGFAKALAKHDGIELFVDHWELIQYFRDYFSEHQTNPTMHTIVRTLGKRRGEHFHHQKAYGTHLYKLFPTDPIHQLCKLAGLPMPPPDT